MLKETLHFISLSKSHDESEGEEQGWGERLTQEFIRMVHNQGHRQWYSEGPRRGSGSMEGVNGEKKGRL